VFLAWINKCGAYYEWRRLTGHTRGWTRPWCWMARQYWIDMLCDLASLGLVVYAVYRMVTSTLCNSMGLTSQPG